MAGGNSQFSWLDNLNALDPGSAVPSPGQQPSATGAELPDDLRAQLEAWTTVTFENDSSSSLSPLAGGPGHHSGFMRELQSQGTTAGGDAEYALKDPSPYAKRPFGNFGHNYSLERGFNAFDHSGLSGDANNNGSNNTSFDEIYAGLGFPTTNDNNVVAGNTDISVGNGPLFEVPDLSVDQDALFAGPMQQQQQQHGPIQGSQPVKQGKSRKSSHSNHAGSDEPRAKKQRVASSYTPVPSPAASVSTPSSSSTTTTQKAPLSKAAILAAQLAELAAKKGLTPEEESARQAELNRVAAEDDKRRRNTAASARFRVKKKQREQALEETVKGLNDRIDKLEKDLEASRNENNFLRDLVIRKVGLSELANPGGAGRLSGGQEGTVGVGTQ